MNDMTSLSLTSSTLPLQNQKNIIFYTNLELSIQIKRDTNLNKELNMCVW